MIRFESRVASRTSQGSLDVFSDGTLRFARVDDLIIRLTPGRVFRRCEHAKAAASFAWLVRSVHGIRPARTAVVSGGV